VDALTVAEVQVLNNLSDVRDPSVNLGNKVQSIITALPKSGTPVNAVNAVETLTLTGVVIDSEKIIIGDDLYEFVADDAQSVSAPGNIPIDITSYADKAAGTLTLPTQPTSGDTMTIGTKVYTFVPVGTDTADGEISIGADLAEAKGNVTAAINGTDEFNVAHPLVTASGFINDICALSAIFGGTAGNAIATTETFAAVGNVFGATHLESGTNCSAANADGLIISAITEDGTEGVVATQGSGTTVVLTADVPGEGANDLVLNTQMANGSWGSGHLAGGVNGTVGDAGAVLVDATYLYVAIAANTIADKNWRCIPFGL